MGMDYRNPSRFQTTKLSSSPRYSTSSSSSLFSCFSKFSPDVRIELGFHCCLFAALMRFAPDLSTDSCEIARERVSLRILEEMLDLVPADGADSIGTGSGGNVLIDVSERAVDVLFKVMKKILFILFTQS